MLWGSGVSAVRPLTAGSARPTLRKGHLSVAVLVGLGGPPRCLSGLLGWRQPGLWGDPYGGAWQPCLLLTAQDQQQSLPGVLTRLPRGLLGASPEWPLGPVQFEHQRVTVCSRAAPEPGRRVVRSEGALCREGAEDMRGVPGGLVGSGGVGSTWWLQQEEARLPCRLL